MIDDGATISLIDSKVIEEIGATRNQINMKIKGIGGADAIIDFSEKARFEIQGISTKFHLKNVLVIENLSLSLQCVNAEIVNYCKHKTGVSVNPYETTPTMIVRQDNCDLIITQEF